MTGKIFNNKFVNFHSPVPIAPLVTFRIVFGLLMFFSLLRFWWRGWITTVYVLPKFHFTYWGFEWVQPFGNTGMHLLFFIIILFQRLEKFKFPELGVVILYLVLLSLRWFMVKLNFPNRLLDIELFNPQIFSSS